MSEGPTGKSLSSRIPLDYVHHPNRVERWKRLLALVAFVVAIGWVVVGLRVDSHGVGLSDWGRLQASRGPVAEVHAAWESNCEACHVPFAPMSGENWASALHPVAAANQRCETCHAGTAHHQNMAEPEIACASCHHDHRGRHVSLVDLPDSDCTRCHSGLDAHMKTSVTMTYAKEIQSFASGQGHPEFRSLEKAKKEGDPGRLKFNHALHMSPGLVRKSGETPLTLASISDLGQRAPLPQARSVRILPDPAFLRRLPRHRYGRLRARFRLDREDRR